MRGIAFPGSPAAHEAAAGPGGKGRRDKIQGGERR